MAKKLQNRITIDTEPSGVSPNYPFRSSAGSNSIGVSMSTITQTITGENDQSLTYIKLTSSYTQLNAATIGGTTLGGKACYWYIKNTQPAGRHKVIDELADIVAQGTITDVIVADDGDQIIARLAPGEFMFFCSADNTKLSAKSATGVVGCEYMCFHME